MQTIIIRLEPEKLNNPDLDLRYRLPERIEEVSDKQIQDNGYDYLDGQAIGVWLKTQDADAGVPIIIEILKAERFLENDLSLSAEIYLSKKDAADFEECRRVYPAK